MSPTPICAADGTVERSRGRPSRPRGPLSDGTGFGLAIVEQIAHAHEWEVSLAEGASGGARFEFHDVVPSELPPAFTATD